MVKLLISFLVVVFGALSFSQNDTKEERLFDQANALYRAGKFPEALQGYEQLYRRGSREAALCCNLANAHFQTGNVGKAVLYYEKARLTDPLDAEILHNLQRVSGKQNNPELLVISDLQIDPFFLMKLVKPALNLGSLLVLVAGFLYLAGILNHRKKFAAGLKRPVKMLGFAGILLLGLSGGFYLFLKPNAQAYIVIKPADSYLGPSALARKAGALEAGEKVTVENSYQGWFKVRREAGAESWVPQELVAQIGE